MGRPWHPAGKIALIQSTKIHWRSLDLPCSKYTEGSQNLELGSIIQFIISRLESVWMGMVEVGTG